MKAVPHGTTEKKQPSGSVIKKILFTSLGKTTGTQNTAIGNTNENTNVNGLSTTNKKKGKHLCLPFKNLTN